MNLDTESPRKFIPSPFSIPSKLFVKSWFLQVIESSNVPVSRFVIILTDWEALVNNLKTYAIVETKGRPHSELMVRTVVFCISGNLKSCF